MINRIFVFAIAMMLSIAAGLLASNRSNGPKDRNDTAAYQNHYQCVAGPRSVDSCRTEISGAPLEVAYEAFAALSAKFLRIDDFNSFKLLLAIIIFSLVLGSVLSCSSNAPLTAVIILLDFRFWEYGANVLRHGAAASFLALALFLLLREKPLMSFGVRMIGAMSHLSALVVLWVPRRVLSRVALSALVLGAGIATIAFEYWGASISSSDFSEYKLAAYIAASEGYSFGIPLHYAGVMLLALPLYSTQGNKVITISFNFAFLLLLASIPLGVVDLSYRMISFMLPAISLLIPEVIACYAKRFGNPVRFKLFATASVTLVLLGLALRNADIFLIHLS